MKYIIFIIILVSLSCSTQEINNTVESEKTFVSQEEKYIMNNPVLIYGSSFGEYIQSLHNLNEYDQMLTFTSKETINEFGRDSLLSFYSNMAFSYPLDLIKYDTVRRELIYKTTIEATERKLVMPIVIEKDTVKMVFNKLNSEFPFKVN